MSIAHLRLKRAMEKNTECFLCNLETEIEQKYLNDYLQELVMDSNSRERIVESRGFCNSHSYKLLIEASKPTSSADGHGIALIMKSVTEQLVKELPTPPYNSKYNFFKTLAKAKKCPACIHVGDFMKMYISEADSFLASSDDFIGAFKQSKGLCIPHFMILVRATKSLEVNRAQKTLDILYRVEDKNLRRLDAELSEYIRKQSYEFSEKERAAIANVQLRSIQKIAGRRGIMTPEQT